MSEMPSQDPGHRPVASGEVVVASASAARRRLLTAAGIACGGEAAPVAEAEIKASLRAQGMDAAGAAAALAEAKAMAISARRPEAWVIGGDQILVCEGEWFDKPAAMPQARAQLRALRGREHELCCAVCVVRGGASLWCHVEHARLVMRRFSDRFLDRYLAQAGSQVLESVGAYQVEGLGIQLFSRIEGDYFAILGLPLLPLLAFLRQEEVIAR